MTVWYKQGVIGNLQPIARKGLGNIGNMYAYYGEDLYVTSLRDGNHSMGSLHYDGLAFDFRKGNRSLDQIRGALSKDWDLVDEDNHIHAEYDPK